jgi:myo-inositol 2-dehydrogenase/D-chiro-inositol 1-dehydrogenase
MKTVDKPKTGELSRRQLLGQTATVASLAALSADMPPKAHAAGTDAVKLGLIGCGGRQVRVGPDYGEIFDHRAVEYTYRDGTKMSLFCRHIPGYWSSFGGVAHGTKGEADLSRGVLTVRGQEPQRFEQGLAGRQAEHNDLSTALDAGQPYNEGDYGISSTMTAILGRMATYSGQIVTWDDAIKSDTDLQPERYVWDVKPPVMPGSDGLYPCAMPGQTRPY